MYKRIMAIALSIFMATTTLVTVAAAATMSTSEAIKNYQQYYDDYTKDELVKVDQYQSQYASIKGSLADQIVDRAIWYMNNGYMVYGHGRKEYAKTGIVDCSNFTSLVYSDFNFDIPTAVKEYGAVGTKVAGVYAQKDGSHWTLQGTENLRPGDLLTWYKTDAQGNQVISHVAIFMGTLNGQPAVIGTRGAGNPTAIGIVNDFSYWWGSNFYQARRVLPADAWTPGQSIAGHAAKPPVIPENPILPPQRPVVMPGDTVQTAVKTPTAPIKDVQPKTTEAKTAPPQQVQPQQTEAQTNSQSTQFDQFILNQLSNFFNFG